MLNNTVVARFKDGRTVKGTTLNVDPSRPTCHIRTDAGPIEVKLADLKALFFVKDPEGNPAHNESMAPSPGDTRLVGAQPIAVEFQDGECIVGVTPQYPPTRPFFYIIPVDPESNNLRVLVNRKATTLISQAPARRTGRA